MSVDMNSARTLVLASIEEAARQGNEIVAARDAATKQGGPSLKTVRDERDLSEFPEGEVRDAVAKYRKNDEAIQKKNRENKEAILSVLREAGIVGAASTFDKDDAKKRHAEFRDQYVSFIAMGKKMGAITQEDVDNATKFSGWTSGTVSADGAGTIRPRFSAVTVDGEATSETTSTAVAALLNGKHKGEKAWKRLDANALNALLPENYKDGPSTVEVGPHTVVFTPLAGK